MPLPFDSVYFLMAPGWRTEARSNRWNYGRRWARRAPVVLVQPELGPGETARSEPEPRLDNVEILSVRESSSLASFAAGLVQAEQISSLMRRRGHRWPLLWLYNPYLVFAYALLPAVARVFHATENHFDFDVHADFLDMLRAVVAVSDKIICCSTGLLADYRAASGRDNVEMVPNGCDYAFYAEPAPAAGDWPLRLQPAIAAGQPIAVFAGNINWRMDLPLMQRLAQELPQVHFAYAGQVQDWFWGEDEKARWAALLDRRNVSYLGNLDAGDLPALYHRCDRGFIPYLHLPVLVENGFPLKALEMAAAGLPVVSSLMQPLLAAADAVAVVPNADAFVASLKTASRRTRSAEAAARAEALCRRHDYDRLFEEAFAAVLAAPLADPPAPAALAPVYEHIALDRAARDLGVLEAHAAETDRRNIAHMQEIDRLNEVYPAEIAALGEELRETRLWRGVKRGASLSRILARHPLGRALLAESAAARRLDRDLVLQLARLLAVVQSRGKASLVPLLCDAQLVLHAAPAAAAASLRDKAAAPGDLRTALVGGQIEGCTLVIDAAVAPRNWLLRRRRYELPALLRWFAAKPERALQLTAAPPADGTAPAAGGRLRQVPAA